MHLRSLPRCTILRVTLDMTCLHLFQHVLPAPHSLGLFFFLPHSCMCCMCMHSYQTSSISFDYIFHWLYCASVSQQLLDIAVFSKFFIFYTYWRREDLHNLKYWILTRLELLLCTILPETRLSFLGHIFQINESFFPWLLLLFKDDLISSLHMSTFSFTFITWDVNFVANFITVEMSPINWMC